MAQARSAVGHSEAAHLGLMVLIGMIGMIMATDHHLDLHHSHMVVRVHMAAHHLEDHGEEDQDLIGVKPTMPLPLPLQLPFQNSK